ncbi:curli production assembly protein CsgF [Dyadobacter luteus]|jgi:curli production assembly/transport component CsgF|uniref:Curli production assembly/transport component CsgF n=1 Tax=Dyadobacter luteus TaxID=2259619 RepID=A0A3D8Y5H3_9BACT|nr:curli production assembly/transport component CsgF [Dyadobacter luteus]REA57750.1 curli production assembly protein CsgF [Dyadobacter luteus]
MKKYYISFIIAFLLQHAAFAQSFVYRPQNPSFGGDTFNYNWLLSSAQVQDKTKDPLAAKTSATGRETDALTDFTSSLNRQLLSTLSRQLFSNQFGEEGIKEGTYQYGDFVVDVSPGSEGLVVRITDGKGGETSITVPYY